MKTRTLQIFIVLSLLVSVATGCEKSHPDGAKDPDRVMILWSAGFNSISSYLENDVDELKAGSYVPTKESKNILLVVSKFKKSSSYADQVSPTVVRLYRSQGSVVADTVMTLDKGTRLADAGTFRSVLTSVKTKYPASHYGLIISSHGTGWLPEGYYSNPKNFESTAAGRSARAAGESSGARSNDGRTPYIESPAEGEGHIAVKTATQEVYIEGGQKYSVEVGIEELAAAIPMHMDYILFDMCLMGGVETVYALKDVADYIVVSPAETLAEGFIYDKIAEKLLKPESPDLKGACEDFFNYYNGKNGDYQSATVTMVKTSGLDELASTCKILFEKNRDEIDDEEGDDIQGYFRFDRHYFYDLEDILRNAEASKADLAALETALSGCIPYKAATKTFIPHDDGFSIDHYCGLSMYLPSEGSDYLDAYYKTLSWNKATGLVD